MEIQIKMEENTTRRHDQLNEDADKRVRKIKKFYKELANWAGVSVFLIALNLFLSGGISWAKYPVFFWGIALALQFFNILRLQRLDREWEEKMIRKFRKDRPELREPEDVKSEDYSDELLRNERVREREMADLSEYRRVNKPWRDEDLV